MAALLGGTDLAVEDVASLCQVAWDKLQILHVSEAFGMGNVKALTSATAMLSSLCSLRFRHSKLGRGGVAALLEMAWPSLCTLSVYADDIGLEDAVALAGASLARLPALRELDLAENSLKSEGLDALVQSCWPCLQVLNCNYNEICRGGIAALTAAGTAGKFPALRELHLGENDLGGDVHVLVSTHWPLLEVLDLQEQSDGISVAAARALAAASTRHRLPKLRELDLSNSRMSGEAVAALAQGRMAAPAHALAPWQPACCRGCHSAGRRRRKLTAISSSGKALLGRQPYQRLGRGAAVPGHRPGWPGYPAAGSLLDLASGGRGACQRKCGRQFACAACA